MADLNVIYRIAADITGLQDGVKRAADATEKLEGTVSGIGKKIAGHLAAAFTVAAVGQAIRSYAEFTSTISDLSAKTGIGAESLQRLKYAAEQNGGTIDQVTTAITKLGANLAGGDKSAVGALNALGLSLDTVRAMKPDDAFTAIGDAIAKVPDPMDRSRLAMDLFGKSGADLLPMLTGHLSETAAAADALGIVMSEDAVQAGDKFGDSMDSLMAVGQAVIAQVLQPFIPAITTVAMWLGEYIPKAISGARSAFDFLIKKGMEVYLAFQEVTLKIVELGAKVPWLGAKMGATTEKVAELRAGVQFSKDAIAAFENQTQKTGKTVEAAGGSMAKLSLNYKKNAEEAKKTQAATEKHEEAVRKLVDSMGGGDAVKAANLWLEALPKIGGLTKLTKDEKVKLNKVISDGIDGYRRLGQEAPAALQQVWIATANLAEPIGTIEDLWTTMAGSVQPVQDRWSTNFVLIGQKFTALQQEMTLSNLTGIQLRLAEIDIARERELASLSVLMVTHKTEYEQLAAMVNAKYKQMVDDATGASKTIAERAREQGFITREELQKTAEKADLAYKEMLASGLFTIDELNRAHIAAEEAKERASGKRKDYELSAGDAVLTGTMQILNELGKKHKAAAIAGAIISTYMAIAKALASSPWPWNLVAAAGAAAAGFANVQAIRNSEAGFATGTPGLDFMDFDQASQVTLHGQEAVIPRGGGHQLAKEIAGVLAHQPRLPSVIEARGAADRLPPLRVDALPLIGLDAMLEKFDRLQRQMDRRDQLMPYMIATALKDTMAH